MSHATGTPGNAVVATRESPRTGSTLLLPLPAGARPKHRSGWVRRKRTRPGEILAAAAEMFSRLGYQHARMSDIATLAGVTKGTIYLYFASKADLFDHCRRDPPRHLGVQPAAARELQANATS